MTLALTPPDEGGETSSVRPGDVARPNLRDGWWWGLLALVVAGLWPLVELIRLVTQSGQAAYLFGDQALLDLGAQRAWHLDQLVGPYSRFGWHHPGPFLFYLLALPVHLFEPQGPGLYFGIVLIEGAAGIALVAVVWRRASALAALGAAVAVTALCLSLTMRLLQTPWNPFVVVLPLVLFTVLCADAARVQPGSLAWAAVVGSFLIQTDINTAPYALLLMLATLVVFTVRWRRSGSVLADRQWVSTVLGWLVFIACWIPSVVELWRDHPNNLTLLWRYFTSNGGDLTPWSVALHQSLNGMTVLPFGYSTNLASQPIVRSDAQLFLGCLAMLVLAVVAAGVAWRRQQALALSLVVAGVGAGVIGVFATSRVTGPVYGYLVIWQSVIPCILLIALGVAVFGPRGRWSGAASQRGRFLAEIEIPRAREVTGVLTALVCVAALVLAALTVVRNDQVTPPSQQNPAVATFAQAARFVLGPSDHVVNVNIGAQSVWPNASGLVDELQRSGRSTTVSPASWVLEFGHEHLPGRPVSVNFDLYPQGDQAAARAFGGMTIARAAGEVLAYRRGGHG